MGRTRLQGLKHVPSAGRFIFDKLKQHAAARFADMFPNLYRDDVPDPKDIGKVEWQTILTYMGASPEEIEDVQVRTGRV